MAWRCTGPPRGRRVVAVAGNRVFRSTDQGGKWDPVSPDLSRDDVNRLEVSGGPTTMDASSAETYATVYALAESPHERGALWAGSDGGLAHAPRNSGETLEDITSAAFPESALISMIEPSTHDAATANMAATRYKPDANS